MTTGIFTTNHLLEQLQKSPPDLTIIFISTYDARIGGLAETAINLDRLVTDLANYKTLYVNIPQFK